MFHPDNIKNKHAERGAQNAVSISLHQYWTVHGGAKGIAQKLKSHIKVSLVEISIRTKPYFLSKIHPLASFLNLTGSYLIRI